MSVALYMDEHVPAAITEALSMKGINVLTVQADGHEHLPDSRLLDRAMELGRVTFTRDEDFLALAAERQRSGQQFAGVVYAHQLRVSIGKCIGDLGFLAQAGDLPDFVGQVYHLPL